MQIVTIGCTPGRLPWAVFEREVDIEQLDVLGVELVLLSGAGVRTLSCGC
jgi:hypothetical protein